MSNTTQFNNYSVPRLLWENLEAVFNNEARKYLRDLANCLEVPYDDLAAKVFPKRSAVKVYLQDSPADSEDLACRAFIESGAIAARCRKPVSIGTQFCCHHQIYRPEINRSIEGIKKLYRLQESPEYPTLWYDDNGVVYNAELKIKGHYSSNTGVLKLFKPM